MDSYFRSFDTCQCTKAEHVRPCGLLHPLLPPSRWRGAIGLDWLMDHDRCWVRPDGCQREFLSDKVHDSTLSLFNQVILLWTPPSSSWKWHFTQATASWKCWWSTTTPQSLSRVYAAQWLESSNRLSVSQIWHTSANAKTDGVLGDTVQELQAFANGRKDD